MYTMSKFTDRIANVYRHKICISVYLFAYNLLYIPLKMFLSFKSLGFFFGVGVGIRVVVVAAAAAIVSCVL